MRGINIQKPWSELILQGKKKVEARRYPLGKYCNEDLWIIETKGAVPSPIVGTVRFASDFKYESIEQWRADFPQHCVTEESEFTWDGQTEMWGWVMALSLPLCLSLSLFSTTQPLNSSTPSTCQPFRPSTFQVFNHSTLQPLNPVTLPVPQPFKPSILQPFNSSALQLFSPAAFHPFNTAGLQPYNPSTLQLFNSAAP